MRVSPSAVARWAPALVFACSLGLVVAAWAVLDRSAEAALERQVTLVADQVAGRLEDHLRARRAVVESLAQEVARDGFEPADFRRRALRLHELMPGLLAVNWIDESGVVTQVNPEEGNRAALGRDVSTPRPSGSTFTQAKATREVQVTPPIELFQGGMGLVIDAPVVAQGRFIGVINGVVRTDGQAGEIAMGVADGFAFELREGDAIAHRSSAWRPTAAPRAERLVDVGRTWTLAVQPTPATAAELHPRQRHALLLGLGAALAAGLAWLTALAIGRGQALASQQQELRRLAQVTDASTDLIVSVDKDGRILAANAAAREFFALERSSDAATLRFTDLCERPEDRARLTAWLADPTAARGELELLQPRADPSLRDSRVFLRRTPRSGPDSELPLRPRATFEVQVVAIEGSAEQRGVVARDVSRRVALEAQLREAQKMEAIGRLTGGIAHDFNNIVAGMLAHAQLALLEEPAPAIAEELHGIEAGALRARELTRSLLAVARPSTQAVTDVDVAAAVRAMEPMLQRVLPASHTLRVRVIAGHHWARADPGQLDTSVLNLVLNARDASPRGGPIDVVVEPWLPAPAELTSGVTAGELPPAAGGAVAVPAGPGPADATATAPAPAAPAPAATCRGVMITVIDEGEGMSPEVRARAIEPFFSTKSRGRGTGLGLSMVYGFVRGSGGELDIESLPGAGTRITLRLPAALGREPGAPPARSDPRAPARHDFAHLLLVEDDRSVGDVVARALRSVARSVVWVTSAEEALVELERGMAGAPGTAAAITVIVSDIDLPGADGVSFAARCRARGYAGPLLLISGDPSREPSPAQLAELRAQFLAKPFTQAQLGDGLDAAVAAAALSSAAAPPQPA